MYIIYFAYWEAGTKKTSRFEGSKQTLTEQKMKKDNYFYHCPVLFCSA